MGAGAVFVYEDPRVQLKLAQAFQTDGTYTPTKASVYLKRVGENSRDFFLLSPNRKTVIDATNFENITKLSHRSIFEDVVEGYTGDGYMRFCRNSEPILLSADTGGVGVTILEINGLGVQFTEGSYLPLAGMDIIEYPIAASKHSKYRMWFRTYKMSGNVERKIIISIDGIIISDDDLTMVGTPTLNNWEWGYFDIVYS